MTQWYEQLFTNYALKYDQESFTSGTLGECDFLEKELNFNQNLKILDVGCGTGRHSIELAKRGYNVVGIDLSESMLNRAKEKALAQNLTVNFQQYDARNLPFQNEFDLAIMLCEGGFCLMESDEMDFQILQGISQALKDNGKLIFTALNGLFPLYHSVKDFINLHSKEGHSNYENNSFDLMTFREQIIINFEDDQGKKQQLHCNERYYVPSEITWLLTTLNFQKVEIFGAKLGAFSRQDQLTTEDYEMLIIAQK
jgi:2-polyprenyl-3-methyl-5-hydroxy-6-metoxy-1,4-benzoquinol methylase